MKQFSSLACLALAAAAWATQAGAQQQTAQAHQRGIEAAERALPTRTSNVKEPAHYQHVYIDSAQRNAGSVQTVGLADAVEHNILASSDLQAKPLAKIEPDSLRWLVIDKGFARPSSLEGVGGAGVAETTFSEVNFPLNEVEIINPENLAVITKVAARLGGVIHVVGYADESGLELSNQDLSERRAKAVAESLISSGVNPIRVKVVGAGVSRIYPGLDQNRRATVAFQVTK